MEHRNISLFRGYSDTESVETSLEEIVNIIKCEGKRGVSGGVLEVW